MNSLRLAVVASLVTAMAASALAADVRVPQDEPNLKDALLTAQPGDRVIVTGGVWRNGRVVSNVTLIGRMGATLSGLWEIQGAGATVEGFAVRDGMIEIETDDVTLRGNRFSAPKYTVMVQGTGVSGTTIEGNRFNAAVVEIDDSTGVVARGNRVATGEIIVTGSGATVEDNVLTRAAQIGVHYGSGARIAHNRGGSISMLDVDDAIVRDNVARADIGVRGARPLVTGNEVVAGHGGLYVTGNDATVTGNRMVTGRGVMSVRGDRVIVTDNFVDNRALRLRRVDTSAVLYVTGAGPSTVLRNDVRHHMTAGIAVHCDDSEVAHNVVVGTEASYSLIVEGSRNSIHDESLRQVARVDTAKSSLVVGGDQNVVADISVDGSAYDGVLVEGAENLIARVHVVDVARCGITVASTSTATGIADCVVDHSRWASLFVLGTDTTVTGGAFTGGRKVDVLDLGTGTEFVSAAYATKSESEALLPYR